MRAKSLLAVLLVLPLAACDGAAAGPPPPEQRQPASAAPNPEPQPPAKKAPPKALDYPAHGSGDWRTAQPQPGGGSGLRYRVRIERDIGNADGFAERVAKTLNDPRGWRADGHRFRRVGESDPADFTIYLATPGTRDELCGNGRDGYTSCRNGDKVVINVARWAGAVPGYNLDDYRNYVVNHEVGHRLGHGHELCPGKGKPAPVMEQQTLGLHGCTANPWPYRDGERITGPSGAYNDPAPPPSGGTR